MEMKLIEGIKIRCEQNTSCINNLEGSLLINGLVQIEKYLFFFLDDNVCNEEWSWHWWTMERLTRNQIKWGCNDLIIIQWDCLWNRFINYVMWPNRWRSESVICKESPLGKLLRLHLLQTASTNEQMDCGTVACQHGEFWPFLFICLCSPQPNGLLGGQDLSWR